MTQPLPVVVVGAGIAGVTAALEAAEAGRKVVLVEREASVGGQVARYLHYFPKMCPPLCGMEINTRRLERNPRIRVLTQTEVTSAKATATGWRLTLTRAPRYVDARCTACGACSEVCPARVQNPFNLAMDEAPAIRLVHPQAWPQRYVIDRAACPPDCRACVDACPVDAIHLDAGPSTEEIEAAAVVLATGWHPYPLEKLPELGGGVHADVISNVQMERLASPTGPTGGKILRPSDGQPPKRVAFVQCAGSRDRNHLPYCSGVCCLASLKQVQYVQSQLPDAEVAVYYIDRRTPGRNETLLTRATADGVRLVKGKVGKVSAHNGSLTLKVEDVEAGRVLSEEADLVVLATGMVPNLKEKLPFPVVRDDDGFGLDDPATALAVAGVARRPEDVAATVRDATGAAAKALAGRRA